MAPGSRESWPEPYFNAYVLANYIYYVFVFVFFGGGKDDIGTKTEI